MSFNPEIDTINGVKLQPPKGLNLPPRGFQFEKDTYQAPSDNPDEVVLDVDPASERIKLLEPFAPWDGNDFIRLPILIKTKGQCTTDHISAAGKLR